MLTLCLLLGHFYNYLWRSGPGPSLGLSIAVIRKILNELCHQECPLWISISRHHKIHFSYRMIRRQRLRKPHVSDLAARPAAVAAAAPAAKFLHFAARHAGHTCYINI